MSFVQTFVDAFKKAAGKSLDKADVDTKELARNSGGSLGSTTSGESFTPLRPAPLPDQQPGLGADLKVEGIAVAASGDPEEGGEAAFKVAAPASGPIGIPEDHTSQTPGLGAGIPEDHTGQTSGLGAGIREGHSGQTPGSGVGIPEDHTAQTPGSGASIPEDHTAQTSGLGAGIPEGHVLGQDSDVPGSSGAEFKLITGIEGDYKVHKIGEIKGESKDDVHKVAMERLGTSDDGGLAPGLKVEDIGTTDGGTIFKAELLDGGLKLDHKIGDLKVDDLKYDDDLKSEELLDWKSKDGMKMVGDPGGGESETTPLGELKLTGAGFKVEGDDALVRESPLTPSAPSPIPTPYPLAPEDGADAGELTEVARKAGGEQQEYLVVKLKDSQVTSYAQPAPGETTDAGQIEGLKVSGELAETAAKGSAASGDFVFTSVVSKSSPQIMSREEPESTTLVDLDAEAGAGRVDEEAVSAADLPDLDLDADVDELNG